MSDNTPNKDQPNPYIKYSGMVFQMLATILVCAYGGHLIDEQQGNETPGWTIGLSMFGVLAAMWIVIRTALKK